MKNKKIFYLLALSLFLFIVGCSKDDDDPVAPAAPTEFETLISYIEGSDGGYMNTSCPAIVTAQSVYESLGSAGTNDYLIDIRSATDYSAGHIEGAVNVTLANVMTHIKGLTATYDRIILVCYTGQTASFANALLRLSGYNNVSTMKWGMSSWHTDFNNKWTTKISDAFAAQFVADTLAKPAAKSYPTISTGKTTGKEILDARVAAVLAEGFTCTIDATTLFGSLSSNFIVNYWSKAEYVGMKHIPGAYQYTPKADLKSTTFLKTLPTDKPVVVYCYTGQTSANLAAILRVLGYNAKTLMFGANSMINSTMTASKWVATETKNYSYKTGSTP